MAQTFNSPESQPHVVQPEQAPPPPEELSPKSPEQLPEGAETKAEKQPEQTTLDQQVVLPQVVDDTGSDAPVNPQPKQAEATSMPAVADDVDVIEKAWVEKAKQIIKETRDDPHAQEAEFEKLQIEYHKKRYGRDIKPTR